MAAPAIVGAAAVARCMLEDRACHQPEQRLLCVPRQVGPIRRAGHDPACERVSICCDRKSRLRQIDR